MKEAALEVAMLLAVFALATWLTERIRQLALAHQILDHPGARSMHAVATPRGGGTAIVASSTLAIAALGIAGVLPGRLVGALLGGGLLVAVLGFVDDLRQLKPSLRLAGHFAAAAWLLAWLGELPVLPGLELPAAIAWMGFVVAALYVVWMLNLTNFMDGIDGIAATEALTACASGAVLVMVAASGSPSRPIAMVVAAAAAGFLVWNWPPARIFMGDAGSGFLGFIFAAIALVSGLDDPALFWGWNILFASFVADATVTLLRRAGRGKRIHEAHRTHAYQRAALRSGGHRPVTLTVAAINLFWLFPIALLVVTERVSGPVGAGVAYAPLVVIAAWLGAGTDEA